MKVCGFCGIPLTRKNRSKEHIWADWLKPYVGRLGDFTGHTTSSEFVLPETGSVLRRRRAEGDLHRPGDPHSQRLPIVCSGCNGGWMSEIQKQAKPLLLPFIEGKWPDLGRDAQHVIARWATMFTMVVEFADVWTMATSQAEREDFRKTQNPPHGWYIWLGRYNGFLWPGAFNHFGLGGRFRIEKPEDDIPPPDVLAPRNTVQSTAFVLGCRFFQTFSYRTQGVVVDPISFGGQFGAANGVRCIWPILQPVVTAPERTLNDVAADLLSRSFLPDDMRRAARPVWAP